MFNKLKQYGDEFKTFAMRGNVIDMAVGIIIGAAFGKIVDSLVNDVIMPPLGWMMGRVDFSQLFIVLPLNGKLEHFDSLDAAQAAGAVTINYGAFINTIISFILVAFAVFLLISKAGISQSSKSKSSNFRLDRIATSFDPWSDALGTGYQTVQSLYAIGSGGMFGLGLGNSKQKYLYIPEPHNDFIFSILAEELGYLGCILVIGLFAIFIWRGILISMRCQDLFGSVIAIGITTLIAVQAVLNIAVVTGTIPTTGMSLPFLSYGGTALLLLLANVGILLNISRSSSRV